MSLTKRQKKAMEMDIQGYSGVKIAEEVGVTVCTLSKWRADPEYKEEYERRIEENIMRATQKIKGATEFALDRLVELAGSSNERVALGAVNSILDRGLGKAKETYAISADIQQRPLQNISDEQLKKLVQDE